MVRQKCEKAVTVACVNWGGAWGDKRANLEKMKKTVTEAAESGANIIAFPELALSGYECSEDAQKNQKPCSMHTEAAETIPGQSTEEIAKLTRKLGVYVIFGMPEKDAKDPKVKYNSSAIIGPSGILGRYRKINLSVPPLAWTETICFKPGSDLPVFETRFGTIGVLICKDFWKAPELSRILLLKGAKIIFNLAASSSGPGRDEFMTYVTGARAIESMIYTASCNHVGKDRTTSYYGYSTIAGPSYPRMIKIFAQGGDTEEIVSATLSLESLDYINSLINPKKEINWEIIANEYKKLTGI